MSSRRSPHVVNVDTIERHRVVHGDRFEASIGRLGSRLRAPRLGCSIVTIPPGKRASPFHVHHGVDELFFILEGHGTLRLGNEELPLRSGDCTSCVAGGLPHQIVNTSGEPLTYLCVSTISTTDVVDYPDSHKIGIDVGDGVAAPPRMHYFRDGRVCDYWDGE